ncbi:pilus assembly FimT family protein [Rubripirellula reticaptiva]|uniref:General secretion pathway GspH domain-containing protein n=1 Tax=Rubripirellula reticaptiva TaxID=2528013 RepID=A0A5C6FES7_9BACT|nr:prepilin-type N-terminal cleavage/methylation domain-containing protein [Rubripirellula reticaptiva]TWU58091.1 hypothetical protein Poly59_10000 [Rubripirellula reticaptiva]
MRSAFTLIELVVVITIMAVLAAIAALSLGGVMDRYQLGRAAETIERFDSRARREARVTGDVVIAKIDRSRGRLDVDVAGSGLDVMFQLPSRVSISNMRMHRSGVSGSDLILVVDRSGQCPTYAVELMRGNMKRWLVMLGTSGQVISLDNEGAVNALFAL